MNCNNFIIFIIKTHQKKRQRGHAQNAQVESGSRSKPTIVGAESAATQ